MATTAVKNSAKPDIAKTIDGQKFLWDGRRYDTRDDAAREVEAYKNDNFEVRLVEEDGTYRVYTRRLVKEIVVTAP